MGQAQRRYPIGVQTFEKIREGNFLYIDKTELIHELVIERDSLFSEPPAEVREEPLGDDPGGVLQREEGSVPGACDGEA